MSSFRVWIVCPRCSEHYDVTFDGPPGDMPCFRCHSVIPAAAMSAQIQAQGKGYEIDNQITVDATKRHDHAADHFPAVLSFFGESSRDLQVGYCQVCGESADSLEKCRLCFRWQCRKCRYGPETTFADGPFRLTFRCRKSCARRAKDLFEFPGAKM